MSFGDDGYLGIPGDFRPGRTVEVSTFSKWNLDLLRFPNIEEKHNYGAGVKIGILDTGYSMQPGLPIPASVSVFGFKEPHDNNGHGSHVFGICASIARNAEYHICKVLGGDGMGMFSFITKAVYYLVDEKKVHIINMSLGGNKVEKELADAIKYANSKGVVFVTSSGNTGRNQKLFPACMDECISVGSVDRSRRLSNFSTTGDMLDCVAPGEQIESNWNDGTMRISSGTSMAAPHVSGLCALIIDHYIMDHGHRPTVEQLKNTLYSNCDDLGVMGWDCDFGNGLVTIQFHRKEKNKLAVAPKYMKIIFRVVGLVARWWLNRRFDKNAF